MVPFLPFELRFPREWDFWELKKHKEEFHLYRAGVLRTGPISETTDGEGDEVVSPSLPIPSPASSSPGSNLYKEAPAPRTPFSASSLTNEKIRPNGVRYPINPRRCAH